MTIEITQPETEDLILQRMASGAYEGVEDVLLQALKTSSSIRIAPTEKTQKSLSEVFAMVRGLADDVDFSRDRSPDREIDL